ncbi:MAG: hypothetical protein OXD32_05940 [Endozoicomonadaceae bacterium]|nr:hypothetical protein [Endozoicomonadaceae bacterium]
MKKNEYFYSTPTFAGIILELGKDCGSHEALFMQKEIEKQVSYNRKNKMRITRIALSKSIFIFKILWS